MKLPAVPTIVSSALLCLMTGSALPAVAGQVQCRSDPVVILSDGSVVDLGAYVGELPFRIRSVEYTLHVPSGLRAVAVIRTPDWPTTVEKFRIVSDNPCGRFSSSTVVRTVSTGVNVTAEMIVGLRRGAAQGFDREAIGVTVKR